MFCSLPLCDIVLDLGPSGLRPDCGQLFLVARTDLRHGLVDPLLVNWMNRAAYIISECGYIETAYSTK
jgi:hypothetical protein